jgi:predicted ATP-dependent Lon-type protease
MTENYISSQAASVEPALDKLLNQHFGGKVVRKDLTKLIIDPAR